MFTRIAPLAMIALLACSLTMLAQDAETKKAEPKVDPTTAAERAIEKALGSETTLEFIETPLSDVADFIGQLHNIEVVLDSRGLEEVGIGIDTPITANLNGVSLRAALRIVLPQLDLTTMVRDGALTITTPEVAESLQRTKVYAVADILGRDLDEGEFDYDSLMECIMVSIAPSSWDQVGGPGSIAGVDGTLVILQQDEVHDQVARFIHGIRGLRKELEGNPKITNPVSLEVGGSVAAINQALERKTVPIQFIETPLSDVAAFLMDALNVPIVIDRRSLEDLGLSSDAPITLEAKSGSMQNVLNRMLRPLDLTHVVRNEVLMITSLEAAEAQLGSQLYPVADLLSGDLDEQAYQLDDLISMITSTVSPDSWDDVGGPGSICVIEPNILVISQVGQVQRDITRVLSDFRENRVEKPAASGRLVRRVFVLHTPDYKPATSQYAEEIAQKVRLILPELKKSPEGAMIINVGGSLVVKDTLKVQRAVEKLLIELGAVFAGGVGGNPQGQGIGGMSGNVPGGLF